MKENDYILYIWKDGGKKVYHVDSYDEALRKMSLYTSASDATRAVIYHRNGRLKSALKVWTKPF